MLLALREQAGLDLRRRGYPAARLLASGQVAGLTFWLQEQLPGTVLERGPGPGWLIPEVLRLNDAQAGLGDGTCQLSGLIAATLTAGGDGYCVHATLQARPDTRDLLAVVRQTADHCLAGCATAHSRSPADARSAPTSRTCCSGRSTGPCAITPEPAPQRTTCTWPGWSRPT